MRALQLWLAERGGAVVGRISAQVDDLVQDHWEQGLGHWGMFEALDEEAARALIATAEAWLRAAGYGEGRWVRSVSRSGTSQGSRSRGSKSRRPR